MLATCRFAMGHDPASVEDEFVRSTLEVLKQLRQKPDATFNSSHSTVRETVAGTVGLIHFCSPPVSNYMKHVLRSLPPPE